MTQPIVDLTGVAIKELAVDPGVVAIAGAKVGTEFSAGPPAWAPPAVIVEGLGIDYAPLGRTRGAGLQAPTFVARCYGATKPQASQLGNAVVAAMEMRRGRTDAGRLVFLSLVNSGGDVELDPVTKWPYVSIVFTLIGAQHAV